VLSRAIALPTALAQAGLISRLYFANTLGGGAAALLTAVVIVPVVGFDGAVRIGALANLVCAAGGIALGRRYPRGQVEPGAGPAAGPEIAAASSLAWAGWLVHAFVAGATGIAWEVLAFRLIENVAKSRAQTFALILSVFLAGLAFGGLAGDLVRDRLGPRRRTVFLASQTAIYVTLALGTLLLLAVLESGPLAGVWGGSLAEYEPSTATAVLLLNYVALPAVLLFLPATLMGFGFSLSQQLIQTSLARVGRRLGTVQFVNVVGCVAGGTVTSILAIPAIGTAGALRVVVLAGLGYGLVWWWEAARRWQPMVVLVVLLGAIVALPSSTRLWTVLSGYAPERVLFREDSSGLSSIR
jgi:spermidine synthase